MLECGYLQHPMLKSGLYKSPKSRKTCRLKRACRQDDAVPNCAVPEYPIPACSKGAAEESDGMGHCVLDGLSCMAVCGIGLDTVWILRRRAGAAVCHSGSENQHASLLTTRALNPPPDPSTGIIPWIHTFLYLHAFLASLAVRVSMSMQSLSALPDSSEFTMLRNHLGDGIFFSACLGSLIASSETVGFRHLHQYGCKLAHPVLGIVPRRESHGCRF